jgi:multiple sugar transport system substrate-binding protein
VSVRRLRTVSQVLISIIVLAAMLGCSSSNGSTADKTAKDQEVKLKFIWWGKDQRKQDTLKVIALYEKQHPNVHIMTEDYSVNNDVAVQLAMETADQATPDIIQGDYSFIFDYINRDLIEPLNPYIKNKTLSTSDIAKSTLLPGMKGDELYALNILSFSRMPVLQFLLWTIRLMNCILCWCN